MSLTTQLRDAHATINKLHGQLAQVEWERANTECRADHLEMQLEMAKFMQDSRQQEHVHRETIYRDGGRSTIWVTPDEAGDDFGLDDHDVVSRCDIVEDQRAGHYTHAVVPRVAHNLPMTPRASAAPRASATPASGSSSARLNVSFTPTSITISPSCGRESDGPNEID
ncbi:hypothetical protein BDR03DRAFT_1017737 [Suillus americanus]|nr:hypothetical protein BDR03DRAFT_1017737 [Suillus americanus]